MRFHVLGFPHTQTSREVHSPCAYTQKVRGFCEMMMSLGHEVFHYGAHGSTVQCTRHFTVVSRKEQREWFANNDWRRNLYNLEYNEKLPYWVKMNARCIDAIAGHIQPHDLLCIIAGQCQKLVADAFPDNFAVEYGVGYKGGFARFKVYESQAWMHYIYGQNKLNIGRNYDAVIPNYYDPADFPFSKQQDDYLLFIGRMIANKGPHIAADLAAELGVPIIMAGQGVKAQKDGELHGQDIVVRGKHVRHVGTVDAKTRGILMSRARAVVVQTQYIGPFEGVHAEAMLCGTPVLTTDFGVFTETVQNGVNGFRCRTFRELVWAAGECRKLDRRAIRAAAQARFSKDVVKRQYDAYFRQLDGLRNGGWKDAPFAPQS